MTNSANPIPMKIFYFLSFLFGMATAFAPVIPRHSLSSQPSLLHGLHKPSKPIGNRRVILDLGKGKVDDVILDPDYTLAWQFAILGCVIILYHPFLVPESGQMSPLAIGGGSFHLFFAWLLQVQTRRVRCRFEKDAFEFYNLKGADLDLEKGAKLVRKPGNFVVGGLNRWKYKTIVNYDFIPSIDFPLLCYFKETETPKELWDNIEGSGQPHFFPGLCNARQFKKQMELRGVAKK